MKKNKQARIKTSLIVLVASALIGGITVNQISATSTSGIVDTTAAYRDDSFDSLSAKKAQESLASTQQQKRTELEKQKKAQELKEQEAKKVQEQLEKQKAEQEHLEQAAQEQAVKQAQEAAKEQTTTKQASNLQTTTQEQNASEVPETTQETTQQPVTQEAQRTTTVDTQQIPSAGLYIDGICAQIGSYNVDGGQVPTYTPLAYHWNTPQMASHNYYLVDNSNSTGLGQKVLALQIGDPVYLNGHLYHVTSSVTVYPGQYASDYFDFSHGLYIQTCYGASASEGMRTVILD